MKDKYEESTIMQMLATSDTGNDSRAEQVPVELSDLCNDSATVSIEPYLQDSSEQPVAEPSDSMRQDDGQSLEQQVRVGAYSMLAELLRQTPERAVLDKVTGLAGVVEDKDDFAVAMSMLGLAARNAGVNELDDEFHALFIGLGRGELVPYGSWYLTGFLMEKPLGELRGDLARMGYTRTQGTCEPEDHVAALCEVMAMMIDEGRSLQQQKQFFETHVATWLGEFFSDLGNAHSAVFYRAVARFGKAFFDFEKHYLAMGV